MFRTMVIFERRKYCGLCIFHKKTRAWCLRRNLVRWVILKTTKCLGWSSNLNF
jgi:hypothetical protein